MQNEITTKRGLVLFLVVVTMVIFVGLVWLIATFEPWNLINLPGSSGTVAALITDKNCTYPVSYWTEHPELYPPQVVIGKEIYQPGEISGILADETEDPVKKLKIQLVGAYLNIASGADDSSIEATIFQAYGWLVTHPDGSLLPEEERLTSSQLYNALEAYNLGLTGVSACPGVLRLVLSETPTPSGTPGLTASPTPSPTSTPTPSGTATPTGSLTPPMGTVSPSATAGIPGNTPGFPTRTPTRFVSSTPTRTPNKTTAVASPTKTLAPSATNTPVNTTAAPTPTRTSPPAATPTYTPPPAPSPTYTEPPPPSPTITSPPPP